MDYCHRSSDEQRRLPGGWTGATVLEITSKQVTLALEALFPTTGYVVGHRCFGVLAGTRVGRIFTDDPAAPRWGAVQELPFDTLFLGGALDAALVAEVCTTLRRDRDVVFGAQPGNRFLALMPPGHLPADLDENLDLDFTYRSPEVDLERLARTPDGLHLERIDRDLLARCAWGDLMIEMAGSPDQALTHGLGYCLLHGDTIVAEANAGPGRDRTRHDCPPRASRARLCDHRVGAHRPRMRATGLYVVVELRERKSRIGRDRAQAGLPP
jgi:hypothetical protein